jgi:hypothetical protein
VKPHHLIEDATPEHYLMLLFPRFDETEERPPRKFSRVKA